MYDADRQPDDLLTVPCRMIKEMVPAGTIDPIDERAGDLYLPNITEGGTAFLDRRSHPLGERLGGGATVGAPHPDAAALAAVNVLSDIGAGQFEANPVEALDAGHRLLALDGADQVQRAKTLRQVQLPTGPDHVKPKAEDEGGDDDGDDGRLPPRHVAALPATLSCP